MRQLSTQPQTDQLRSNELPRGQAAALLVRQLPGPHHQLEGHLLGIRSPIGTLGHQHMPDDQQQLARNRHDGLGLANPLAEARKGTLPLRMRLHRRACGLDQHIPEIAPPLFGDAFVAMGLATVVHPRAQAGIADQLFS